MECQVSDCCESEVHQGPGKEDEKQKQIRTTRKIQENGEGK